MADDQLMIQIRLFGGIIISLLGGNQLIPQEIHQWRMDINTMSARCNNAKLHGVTFQPLFDSFSINKENLAIVVLGSHSSSISLCVSWHSNYNEAGARILAHFIVKDTQSVSLATSVAITIICSAPTVTQSFTPTPPGKRMALAK